MRLSGLPWHPLNLHGVKTGSEVFILLHISKDAPRLRIKFLVHSWPGKFSILCSSCYIGIHKSLPPVMSPPQRFFCAPLGGSTSPLTSAASCKSGGEKEVFLQLGVLNLIFNSCKAAECPALGLLLPLPACGDWQWTFILTGSDSELLQLHRLLMNPLITEAKQEHQNWAPASSNRINWETTARKWKLTFNWKLIENGKRIDNSNYWSFFQGQMITSTSNTPFLSLQNFLLGYIWHRTDFILYFRNLLLLAQLPKMLFLKWALSFQPNISGGNRCLPIQRQAGYSGRQKIPPRTAKIKHIPLEELLPPKYISKIHSRIFIILFSLSKNTSNIKITGRREVRGKDLPLSWFYSPGWL